MYNDGRSTNLDIYFVFINTTRRNIASDIIEIIYKKMKEK